jgi:heat shock protein HspQ
LRQRGADADHKSEQACPKEATHGRSPVAIPGLVMLGNGARYDKVQGSFRDKDKSPLAQAKFAIGQIIRHRLFGYRGVIFDVDAVFSGTEEWYETTARSRPPKDRPWYHVLVHDAVHTTYVAERNLELEDSPGPVSHPLLEDYFDALVDDRYRTRRRGVN